MFAPNEQTCYSVAKDTDFITNMLKVTLECLLVHEFSKTKT
jgi:hypothetical protein